MSTEKILIVDDEIELTEIIQDYLINEGYFIKTAFDGYEAINIFKSFKPDLVILDIMLPKIDGMEVCRQLRMTSNIPIIMMSARSSDIDKVLGLGLGADDYIVKPFNMPELIARVKAHLRRYISFSSIPPANENIFIHGDLTINTNSYTIYKNEKLISLAAKEFELLSYFAQHPQQVFSKEQLFDSIWGFNEYGDINTVTVHIRKIREKIEDNPSEPKYIKTVWGVGYKFEGDMHE